MSDVAGALAAALARRGLGVPEALRRLTGGASRETWAFDVGDEALILRRDPKGGLQGVGMAVEVALLEAAAAAAAPVPGVRFVLEEDDGLGAGYVMERIEGETIPRKILRDDEYAAARPRLARQCGEILARIHTIVPDAVPGLPVAGAKEQIAQYRSLIDGFGEAHPAFELGLRWLDDHAPAPARTALVHGDFRNGNLVVGPDGVRAVLDWELAHGGDPMEDLGWMCVRSWRFGADDKPAGGFGSYDELFAGYTAGGGDDVDPEVVRYWEVFGNLKWGVICMVQAFTHLNGLRRSVELATLGRRVCEMEYDLMELIT